jgi:flagellar motor switch protein FliM
MNPQFVTIVPPSDVVILSTFTLEMDEFSGSITICIPYSLVEPLRNKLYTGFQSERLEVDVAWLRRLVSRLLATDVALSSTLGDTEITGRQLLELKVGDIVPLRQDATEMAQVQIEKCLKYRAVVGTSKGSKAVMLKQRLRR